MSETIQLATAPPDYDSAWYSADGGATWLRAETEPPTNKRVTVEMIEAATHVLIEHWSMMDGPGPADFVYVARAMLEAALP